MKNIFFVPLVILFCLAFCVRGAYASGTVAVVPGSPLITSSSPCTYPYGATHAVMVQCYTSAFGGYEFQYIAPTGPGTHGTIRWCYAGHTCTSSSWSSNIDVIWYSAGSSSCPANSTGTSTCTCNDPYVPSSDGTACVMPACPATGTSYSSGFYDVGTIDNGASPPTLTCSSSCQLEYYGSNAQYHGLVNGVMHYYALGSYQNLSTINGGSCSAGVPAPGSVGMTLPVDSCAIGTTLVTGAGGFSKCYSDSTGQSVSTDSASSVAATDAANAAAAAAAGAAAAKAANDSAKAAALGQGQSAASAVEAGNAAGIVAGGQAAGAAAAAAALPSKDPCQNSSTIGCMQAGTDTVSDSVPLGTKSITVSSIVPVIVGGAGSCPAPAAMTIHGQTYYFKYDTYCNFATGIKPIILAFAWLLSAGLLIGSFKSS